MPMIVSARQKVFALWYFTVVGLLTALTLEQLFRFNLLSPVFWLRLAVYAVALIFSFYVLGEYIHNRELALEELRRIQRAFTTQLSAKEKQIEELQEKTSIALKTAAKQAGKIVDAERAATKLAQELERRTVKKRVKSKKE